MNDFGKLLKELRGNKSLREVQKGTGISHTYLSTLEKGYDPRTKKPRKPTPEVLKNLANYYDVKYSFLMQKAGYLPHPSLGVESDYEERMKEYLSKNQLDNPLNYPTVQSSMVDLHEFLNEGSTEIDINNHLTIKLIATYKNRILTKEEIKKISVLIQTILD